ncbi:MAG: hypothetical protein DWP95_01540 [Proteobacteria bacterium]|nr:MAG: hypothetical protein DWP95_01540 [Pseudomonadota bacterium]
MKLLLTTCHLVALLFINGLGQAQELPDIDDNPEADSERSEVVCYAAKDRWVCAPKGSKRPTATIENIKAKAATQAEDVEQLSEDDSINPLDPPTGVESMTDNAPEQPVVNPMAETPQEKVTEQPPQSNVVAEPDQPEVELPDTDQVTTADQVAASTQAPDYVGDNWFQHYPDHWTIQIIGVANQQNLEAFIRQQQLTDHDYRIVETRANDAPWWVVIYGHYPSRDDADMARNNLPKNLASDAWLRPLSSLAGEY